MKKISIVTVDFNSEKETHDCLTSLRQIKIPENTKIERIVIDNASKNPFVPTEQEKKDGIILIRTDKNLGFTGGYNTGMKHALKNESDFIFLLNNDTIVDKNILAAFLSLAETNKNIGLIGPKIYFAKGHEFHKDRYTEKEKGKVLWYAGGGFDWKNVLSFHRGVDKVDSGQYDASEETEFVSGCCMFFRRDVLEKVGMFDNRYFLYFEDADICLRTKKAGYTIFYHPKAFLWHINAASSGVGSALHDYFITRNRMLFGMQFAHMRSKFSLIRESIRILQNGREWQKKGIRDFYLRKFGRGSFGI